MAQDIHFSQFYETVLLRNPALGGDFNGDYRVQASFHDQWHSITNAYRTGSLSGEYKIPVGRGNDFITAGMEMLYDKAGTAALSTTEVLPAFNYHLSLSDRQTSFLSLGFMAGFVQKSIDLSKVTTNSQYNGTAYDPSLPNGETILSPNVRYWDGSMGLSYNTTYGKDKQNSFFVGAALHHLNRPKNSFYKNPAIELDPKYVFSGGTKIGINEFNYFTIQADQTIQSAAHETVFGLMYSYRLGLDPDDDAYVLHLGSFLRWKDALVPVVKLEMHRLCAALSYDVNVSELKTASQSRGGFELTLSYTGLLDRDNSKGAIPNPRF